MDKKYSSTRAKGESFLIWTMGISCIVLGILFYAVYIRFRPNTNKLALGEKSSLIGIHNIKLNPPIEMDFKSKAEILTLRREEIGRASCRERV